MQWNLSKVLSFNAGYVDTASFLALHGLFAAHVTGNFVTLGAALISDNHAGAWTKLAALPMFCVVVLATRLLHTRLERLSRSSYQVLLQIMLALFAVAAALAWLNMPFAPTDTWISFAVGMLLVAAMAIQNALHRIHWLKESPTTVMTGSTTQLMLDVADWLGSPQGKAQHIRQSAVNPCFHLGRIAFRRAEPVGHIQHQLRGRTRHHRRRRLFQPMNAV